MIKAIALLALLFIPTITSSTDRELNCLTSNVYYEARGESHRGKLAVALTTLNRVDSDQYPKTICGVVFQKRQFSWTQGFKPTKINPKQWREAQEAALYAYLNRDVLGRFRATHFHNNTIHPGWKLKRVAKIGNHTFYM